MSNKQLFYVKQLKTKGYAYHWTITRYNSE